MMQMLPDLKRCIWRWDLRISVVGSMGWQRSYAFSLSLILTTKIHCFFSVEEDVTGVFIIAKIDKVCVKFSFLTETLTLPRYDGDTKSERVMKNELREKGCGADRAADGRNRHAVLWCLAGRGGDGAKQSHQTMSGVCGHWIRSFQAFRRPCPASGAGFRRGRRC